MKHNSASPPAKPYDIRERVFLFAVDVMRVAQKLHSCGGIGGSLSEHLVDAAVSAAANIEEADDGSSKRDFLAKERITLREVKETRLRLRVLRAANLLAPSDDPLIEEANQLVKILGKIIYNAGHPTKPPGEP